MADAAADPSVELVAVRSSSRLLHAVPALVLLLLALVLAVCKPRGLTRSDRRRAGARSARRAPSTVPG